MSPSPYVNVVAADLRAAEAAVDQSIARAATVLAHLDARAAHGLAAGFAHTAVVSLGEAIQQGIGMRSRLVQAHDRVTQAAEAQGMALGGWTEDKPARPSDVRAGVTEPVAIA